MNKSYDVLELCLQEIENGADIDTVLFRYPEFAEELRPILETSVKAKGIAVPEPSSDVLRRNRAKVLEHAAQLREAQASPRAFWPVSLRRALVSVAVVATLFISSTGLVRAASTTLPGDNLYPVKRTWEDVLVLFTFNLQAREALEVEHENERLEEVFELFGAGRSAKVDFAGYVTRQNGDLWLVSKIPVVISPQTDLRAVSIAQGAAVRVRGLTQSDGTVLAERVDLLDAGVPLPDVDDHAFEIENDNSGNDNEVNEDNSGPGSENESPEVESTEDPEADSRIRETSLEGTVDSINGNILIVDGQPMNISNAEIRGEPAVGRRVKVEGYYDATGVFIVTKIEFLESESGGDHSGSDDPENESNEDNGVDDSNENNTNDDNGNENGNDNDNDNDNSGSGGGGDD
jgi:hypothetical protein